MKNGDGAFQHDTNPASTWVRHVAPARLIVDGFTARFLVRSDRSANEVAGRPVRVFPVVEDDLRDGKPIPVINRVWDRTCGRNAHLDVGVEREAHEAVERVPGCPPARFRRSD
ncbi:MAG: hypothetical protein OEU89_02700, partial [Burkholderiaceae bacterium]|nr:hypothetical protein [Burkholderiaceae bacterium]